MSRLYNVRKSISLNGWIGATEPSSNVMAAYPTVSNDIDSWGCDTWILYYKLMKAKLGKVEAQRILLIDADRASFFATLFTSCKGDCNFINYFKSEGIPTGNFITDLYCGTTQTAVDIVEGTGAIVSGASNTAKTIGTLLPVVIIGGTVAYGVYLYRKYGKK
jgi:hypothetical protein